MKNLKIVRMIFLVITFVFMFLFSLDIINLHELSTIAYLLSAVLCLVYSPIYYSENRKVIGTIFMIAGFSILVLLSLRFFT